MGAGKRFFEPDPVRSAYVWASHTGFYVRSGAENGFLGKAEPAWRARRPKIVNTVVPEMTFKRSIEPHPDDYGVSYLARILETD